VEENRAPGTPPVGEGTRFKPAPRYPASVPPIGSDYRQPTIRPTTPAQAAPLPSSPAPRPRADRIASLSRHNVEGHVVGADRVPKTGARVLLVSAEKVGQRQVVTTDGAGQFRANLASGGWLVYVHDASGRPVFARRMDVQEHRTQQVTLVDR
jgi:hypothetical protein